MKRTLTSLILAAALSSPAAVFALSADGGIRSAEHHRHGRGHHMLRLVTRHAQELGIEARTIESMKVAFESARPEFQRLHQQVQQARQSGDETKVAAAKEAMHQRRQALRTTIDGMLTDKQKAAIKQLMERRRQERRAARPTG
jgi:hypothetical protein